MQRQHVPCRMGAVSLSHAGLRACPRTRVLDPCAHSAACVFLIGAAEKWGWRPARACERHEAEQSECFQSPVARLLQAPNSGASSA